LLSWKYAIKIRKEREKAVFEKIIEISKKALLNFIFEIVATLHKFP